VEEEAPGERELPLEGAGPPALEVDGVDEQGRRVLRVGEGGGGPLAIRENGVGR